MAPEYLFYRISLRRTREGLAPEEDHRDVITAHAAQGWRLVQVVPFESAQSPHLEVIFSRERAV